MDFLKLFKLDQLWKVVFWLGVSLFITGITIKIEVVNPKHLIGIGIGLILAGGACFAANKHVSRFMPDGILSTEKIIHNRPTLIFFITGTLIAFIFFILLIINLF
jgi:hypothetical protein